MQFFSRLIVVWTSTWRGVCVSLLSCCVTITLHINTVLILQRKKQKNILASSSLLPLFHFFSWNREIQQHQQLPSAYDCEQTRFNLFRLSLLLQTSSYVTLSVISLGSSIKVSTVFWKDNKSTIMSTNYICFALLAFAAHLSLVESFAPSSSSRVGRNSVLLMAGAKKKVNKGILKHHLLFFNLIFATRHSPFLFFTIISKFVCLALTKKNC